MTHKQARITKGFARKQCEAFAEEYRYDDTERRAVSDN